MAMACVAVTKVIAQLYCGRHAIGNADEAMQNFSLRIGKSASHDPLENRQLVGNVPLDGESFIGYCSDDFIELRHQASLIVSFNLDVARRKYEGAYRCKRRRQTDEKSQVGRDLAGQSHTFEYFIG